MYVAISTCIIVFFFKYFTFVSMWVCAYICVKMGRYVHMRADASGASPEGSYIRGWSYRLLWVVWCGFCEPNFCLLQQHIPLAILSHVSSLIEKFKNNDTLLALGMLSFSKSSSFFTKRKQGFLDNWLISRPGAKCNPLDRCGDKCLNSQHSGVKGRGLWAER